MAATAATATGFALCHFVSRAMTGRSLQGVSVVVVGWGDVLGVVPDGACAGVADSDDLHR